MTDKAVNDFMVWRKLSFGCVLLFKSICVYTNTLPICDSNSSVGYFSGFFLGRYQYSVADMSVGCYEAWLHAAQGTDADLQMLIPPHLSYFHQPSQVMASFHFISRGI